MSYNSLRSYVFLFIVVLHITDIISAFWRYTNKSRSRPRLLKQLLNLNSIAFEKLLTCLNSIKPHMLLVTGDFNVRSSSWWSDDIDKIEGTRLESITSYYGLYQITNKPTHILPSSSSCIDLIFTN